MTRRLLMMVLFLSRPAAAAAQTDPHLVSAVRLAQEGLSDSARAIVGRLSERTPPTDSLYPQVLYTRALIAAEPAAMRTDLQRVVVEYASSNWADDALLRLALLEYAAGQLEAAARHFERFELDHSASPLYARAAVWAGRVYFQLQRPADACRWLRLGGNRASDDVELRAELTAASGRCGPGLDTATARAPVPEPTGRPDTVAPVAAAPRDTTPPAPPPDPPAPPPDPTTSAAAPAFRIQIAAVTTPGAADSIAARARAAGFAAIVTREAPHYKVRIGAYSTRAEAAAALPAVRTRFRGAPFVVAARE
jgi:hypothetical protein